MNPTMLMTVVLLVTMTESKQLNQRDRAEKFGCGPQGCFNHPGIFGIDLPNQFRNRVHRSDLPDGSASGLQENIINGKMGDFSSSHLTNSDNDLPVNTENSPPLLQTGMLGNNGSDQPGNYGGGQQINIGGVHPGNFGNGQQVNIRNGQSSNFGNGQTGNFGKGQQINIVNNEMVNIVNGQQINIRNALSDDLEKGQSVNLGNDQQINISNGPSDENENGQQINIGNGQSGNIVSSQPNTIENGHQDIESKLIGNVEANKTKDQSAGTPTIPVPREDTTAVDGRNQNSRYWETLQHTQSSRNGGNKKDINNAWFRCPDGEKPAECCFNICPDIQDNGVIEWINIAPGNWICPDYSYPVKRCDSICKSVTLYWPMGYEDALSCDDIKDY